MLAGISIDKMDTEQYLFVIKTVFMQNQIQTLIWLYLALLTIQPDTLTNHFFTQWTGWQEVIYKPYNIVAD